jgi:hypothetical protein
MYKVKIWDTDCTYGYLDYDTKGKPPLSFWGKVKQSLKLFMMM